MENAVLYTVQLYYDLDLGDLRTLGYNDGQTAPSRVLTLTSTLYTLCLEYSTVLIPLHTGFKIRFIIKYLNIYII